MQRPNVIDDQGRLLRQRVLGWSSFAYTLAEGGIGCFDKMRGVVVDGKTVRIKAGREPYLVIELQNRTVATILSLASDTGVTAGELEVTRG